MILFGNNLIINIINHFALLFINLIEQFCCKILYFQNKFSNRSITLNLILMKNIFIF